jgi:hypothetical protein
MSRQVQTDGTLISRVECKYLVPSPEIHALRNFIRPFTRPDRYARLRRDHRYQVCSLYLDNEDLSLYRSTVEGLKNRFKLRIRTYSSSPEEPAFLEVKKRMNDVVRKSRTGVTRGAARRYLGVSHRSGEQGHASTDEDAGEFLSLMRLHHTRPLLRVRYSREAYESNGGDPVRITFDTDLMHAVTLDADFSLDGPEWHPTPVAGTILEIKFTERHPSWIQELIRAFQLQRQSVAKYVLSVDRALELGNLQHHSAYAMRGVSPPHG